MAVSFLRRLLIFGVVSCCAVSTANAAPAAELPSVYRVVATARVSWLWWELYQATLLTPDGRYQPGQRNLMLTLDYARSIPRRDLLDATAAEWQRLGLGTPQEQARWLDALAQMWPDVRPGDRLSVWLDGQGVSHFFHHQQRLGNIQDPRFGDNFLAIWLSPDSRDTALRQQLLSIMKEPAS